LNHPSLAQDIIHELREEVQKFEQNPKGSFGTIIKVSGRNVAYPLRKSTLLKLAEDVDDFKQNLSVALQILQIKDISVLDNDIEEIKTIVKVTQAYNVAVDVRDWLKAPDSSVDYKSPRRSDMPKPGSGSLRARHLVTGLNKTIPSSGSTALPVVGNQFCAPPPSSTRFAMLSPEKGVQLRTSSLPFATFQNRTRLPFCLQHYYNSAVKLRELKRT